MLVGCMSPQIKLPRWERKHPRKRKHHLYIECIVGAPKYPIVRNKNNMTGSDLILLEKTKAGRSERSNPEGIFSILNKLFFFLLY